MKRTLAMVAALTMAGVVHAQGTPSGTMQTGPTLGFGVFAGVSIPVGDLSNGAGTGWHAGGLVSWDNPAWPVGFRVDAAYHGLGSKTESFEGSSIELKPKIVPITGNIVWNFPVDPTMTFKPYIIGGVGFYHLSEDCSGNCGVFTSTSDNKFGINAGIGGRMNLSGFDFFAEARYHAIFSGSTNDNGGSSTASLIPISVGIAFHP